jgi:hypothetical protein
MKRLVYNPRIDCYIKADDGIYDLSPYVTECMVNRKVNQVSPASVTFRNPNFMFTEHVYKDPVTKKTVMGPAFHPQDPIIISMTRLRDRPIQVFTGYCDSTPYLQLFPGIAGIDASCTLKRLMYTYWDPGLTFVWDWLMAHGWQINQQVGGIANPQQEHRNLDQQGDKKDNLKLTDGSFGKLLFDFMAEIGGWDPSTVYIEKLPDTIAPLVTQLFEEFKSDSEQSTKEFQQLMQNLIGTSALGGGDGGTGGGATGSADISDAPAALRNFPRKTQYSQSEVLALCKAAQFPDPSYAASIVMCESSGNTKANSHGTTVTSGSINCCCRGLWQIYLGNSPLNNNTFSCDAKGLANAEDPIISTWNVAVYISNGGSWSPWSCA